MPHFYGGLACASAVWQRGSQAMDEYFQLISERLTHQAWWYGDDWSVMDATSTGVFGAWKAHIMTSVVIRRLSITPDVCPNAPQ
ncbi:hypothetical protein G8770_12555 [Aestuariicella hydrocarbonica]|uniref:Glutathione S-transferase n=1 Tax=Pseudomaricurvus hydrocarbonicus TaxID=1470433 RepID=A0A9E5JXG1_9GAMM|nr:hypothetical protein [Aestuariicella hydrocarbonica]NHO66371.1 hypothetical protein [Aestuariicella hydrocarbonica]